VLFKCEQRSPTGSFKDRGASVLVSWLRERGVRRVVEDSSGNAGVALAAYAARAGIEAEIYVPEDASPSQRERIRNLGARVVAVPGERARAAEAAREAARGCAYASHVHQPHFLAGTKTIAYEIWEQTRGAPPAVVALPVGNGSLLLGLAMGFEEIARAGLPGSAPRIAAYQTDRCAPLARAFAACGDAVDPVRPAPTRARGIAVAQPPRGTEILAAVRRSGGWITAVPEERIGPALREMALRGILLEWTSAVVLAGLEEDLGRRVIPGPIVAVLTAGGFQDLRAEASRPPT
jgi:threonine synthase